ncbi:MAG: hypothetical protein KDD73_15920 [Anaerolineales bacterium]|nr:hypothetical protein [Anaerolineales bacterium]
MKKLIPLLLLTAMLTLLAACGNAETGDGEKGTLTIGSKNFAEQFILGEMYAQLLEANGYTVERQLGLGSTDILQTALVEGEIDIYPEYTSTGLLTVLKEEAVSTDRDAIYQQVKDGYVERFQITWLDPAPFNNTQALAVTRETSEARGLTTISQLAVQSADLRIGAAPEFFEREDGLPGLRALYGEMPFADEKQLDSGAIRYEALLNGDIDVVTAYGTDGQIGGYDLVVLEDDKALWPPYQVAPILLQSTLDDHADIAEILNPIAPLLDDRTMAELNWQVDGENIEPDEVARTFLIEKGLLESE